MWTPEKNRYRLPVLGGLVALTLAIHYGLVLEPLFGDVHWVHPLHGRFCYIPIVIAASWYGLRGGFTAAAVISLAVLPYIFGQNHSVHDFTTELVEIVFYFAIAGLVGGLIDREFQTRQKQQEALLQVERSQRLSLVGQMAAGVAHEIKNPLTSIKGAADILVDKETSPRERDEFGSILRNEVKRIDSTVTEFLDFARPKETRRRELDLSEALRTSIRQIEVHARREQVRVESSIAEGIKVNGDPQKLHQMTLNLALNAIQASPEAGAVFIALDRPGSDFAKLSISDEGPGVKEGDLPRIFEPFFTTKPTGTGLGLALVKSIVDSHEGEIEVDSKPGRGTTITVSLPLLRS